MIMKSGLSWRLWWSLSVLGLPALLFAPCSRLAHASRDADLPDWVMQAAATTGHWGDARAVILLQDTLVTVSADGKATERERMVVKILRQEGRDAAIPAVLFSKDRKLESFHVWSIGTDGHRYAMKDSDYIDVGVDQSGEGILYNDLRVRTASPPGADPGGIVAWEDTTEAPSYMTESWWDFQDDIPTVRTSFEIDLPPGWHESDVWSRHPPVQPTETAPNSFNWELDNVPAIDLSNVSLAPDWYALAGWMSVHYSADPIPQGAALWAQIGNWYEGLAAPQSEGGTDIASEAKNVAPGDDFMTKLENVASFMQQQIRYVGIEVGIGGLKPHSAEEVFRNRYGDCKDKATLMIAMLDAVGIRATWVAVDHRRGLVNPEAPSIRGDHMIMAIQIPAGYENPLLQAVVTAKTGQRYLIFDPTNQWVPIGQIPDYEQGGYGLLVAGTDSQVIQLPVLNPRLESTDRTANLQLAADGTLSGDVTVDRTGSLAWVFREKLSMDSNQDQRQMIEQSLQSDLSTFTLGAESADNILALEKPLVLHFQFTAPLYAKQAGNLLLVRPRVLGTDSWSLVDKPRHYDISFAGVETLRDNFNVNLPPGYVVDDVPDPVNVDAGFATYHSEVKAEGGVLHYERELVLKQVTLPPTDYSELMKLDAAITTDENSDAVLRKQ
jgi:hypothetical protein